MPSFDKNLNMLKNLQCTALTMLLYVEDRLGGVETNSIIFLRPSVEIKYIMII